MLANRDAAASRVSDAMMALDALDAAVSGLAKVDFDVLSSRERLQALQRLETVTRRQAGVGYDLLHGFCEHKGVEEFGGEHAHQVLANALRIKRSEVNKRVHTAEQWWDGPRSPGNHWPPNSLPRLLGSATAYSGTHTSR
jgi:hypothetical protein